MGGAHDSEAPTSRSGRPERRALLFVIVETRRTAALDEKSIVLTVGWKGDRKMQERRAIGTHASPCDF